MAKKSSKNFFGLLSFSALVIFLVCSLLNVLNEKLSLGIPTGTLNMLGTLFLLICVLWSAWTYASSCKKVWRIIYFIILILTILSFVFGLNII